MLKLIDKWSSVVFSWLPYYRNKKRKAEEEAERRRISYEQTLALKNHVLRFKSEYADKYAFRDKRSCWFAIKTEEGRKEYFQYSSPQAAPPFTGLGYFVYWYRHGDKINNVRFYTLFHLVRKFPNGTFTLMGVDTIQQALEDIEDNLLISLEIVDENQRVVERILL